MVPCRWEDTNIFLSVFLSFTLTQKDTWLPYSICLALSGTRMNYIIQNHNLLIVV